MRQEIDALKHGLSGHIRIAAIPTALPMMGLITTPYRARHPDANFTNWSRNSIEVLGMLENLEVDAGLTYLDNEPKPYQKILGAAHARGHLRLY